MDGQPWQENCEQRRTPNRRRLQAASTTFLEFVTVATLEFSQDPGVIQEALANAVTVTLTVETVIEILNTPDMTKVWRIRSDWDRHGWYHQYSESNSISHQTSHRQ